MYLTIGSTLRSRGDTAELTWSKCEENEEQGCDLQQVVQGKEYFKFSNCSVSCGQNSTESLCSILDGDTKNFCEENKIKKTVRLSGLDITVIEKACRNVSLRLSPLNDPCDLRSDFLIFLLQTAGIPVEAIRH